jgi:outer membrane protein assembly factor BamB
VAPRGFGGYGRAVYRKDASEDRSVLVVGLNRRVMGFDAHSGKPRWEHVLPQGSSEVEIVVHEGRVYASSGYQLMCLGYPDGRLIDTIALPGTYKGRPTMLVEGDRLYVGLRGEICCFDLAGQLLWHDGLSGKGVGSVSLGFPDNVRQADDRGTQ